MGISTAVVTASAPTSTGTQNYTKSGFGTPVAAVGFASLGVTNGTAVDRAVKMSIT